MALQVFQWIQHFTKLTLNGKITEVGKLSVWTTLTLLRHKTSANSSVILPKRVQNVSKRPRYLTAKREQGVAAVPHDEFSAEYYDDELDHLASSVATYGSRHSAFEAENKKTKELLKMNSFVRAKTLENQHFRQPKKPNLLTWTCKEQIRLLHEKDPEIWSVGELASKFPVSETSIKKILKSRLRLHRLTDIKEHDQFVKRNWEKVYDSLKSNLKGCTDEVRDALENIGSEENLLNIFPLEDEITSKQLTSLPRNFGVFSSIVKDELMKKESETNILYGKHQEELNLLRKTMVKIQETLASSKEDHQKKAVSKPNLAGSLKKSELSYKTKKDPFELTISNNSEKLGTSSCVVNGCVYDENGDFLYRIP